MITSNLLETTVMTQTFQSQCPTLSLTFVPFPPPYPLSYHHLLWQFHIASFLAPFSWTKTSLAAEGDSHEPLDFHDWIKSLFLQGTKVWLPGDLSPQNTLKIKGLSWATEVLIGQVQLSTISFCVNQLKQNNWELSALLNIYTSRCKYLFTYHLLAIFSTSAVCRTTQKPLAHFSWCLN